MMNDKKPRVGARSFSVGPDRYRAGLDSLGARGSTPRGSTNMLTPRLRNIQRIRRTVSEVSDDSKRKGRSPSYPAIDLEQAVERARRLLERENRHLVPVDTALEAWGYSQASGAGMVVLAALKKFGLLEDQGSGLDRRVRLTDTAYEILIDEREESPKRCELLRQAALRPRIHSDLWNRYGRELPSDSTLRYELRKMGFTDDATNKLIAEWRRTFDFAGLSALESASAPEQDEFESATGQPAGLTVASRSGLLTAPAIQQPAQTAAGQSVQLPLSQGKWAVLSAPFPISELEWAQMLGVLQAMKPALTTQASADEDD